MNEIYKGLIYSLLILIIGSISTIVFTKIISRILNEFTQRTKTKTDDYIVNTIIKVLKPIGFVLTIYLSILMIAYDNRIENIVHGFFKLILLFLLIKCLNKLILRAVERWTIKINDEAIISMVASLNPLIKASIWSLGVIFYLQNVGVQMAAIWALLSAGGIGAGLALKEPVQEFFEYIIILLDKPFQNGEFINIENVWATVERVGVRSTRLRSLNGETIVVSNSFLTNGIISNYAQMNKRRLVHKLGVVYETNLSKMTIIPKIIETIVDSVEDAKFDRCHFVEFGNFSLDFELVYFIPTNNYSKAMTAQQTINLEIIKKFKEEGIDFAFPTQTINLMNNKTREEKNQFAL
tara:strand:- start:73 stop:1125 length:1053 start_codon:yes stop_codon:yes gene_type:complete